VKASRTNSYDRYPHPLNFAVFPIMETSKIVILFCKMLYYNNASAHYKLKLSNPYNCSFACLVEALTSARNVRFLNS